MPLPPELLYASRRYCNHVMTLNDIWTDLDETWQSDGAEERVNL